MDMETYDQSWSPRGRRRRGQLPARGPERHGRACTRASCSSSSCRPRSSSSISTPSRVCRATGPPAAPSRPRWRPAHEIQVPLFLTTGEKIKVDTRDGRLPRPGQQLTEMAARSKARKRALDILFEAEQRGVDALDGARPTGWPTPDAAGQRVHRGAGRGRRGSTASASTTCSPTYSVGWTLDRMPAVDRNSCGSAPTSCSGVDDVPDAVALSEAVRAGAASCPRTSRRRSSTGCWPTGLSPRCAEPAESRESATAVPRVPAGRRARRRPAPGSRTRRRAQRQRGLRRSLDEAGVAGTIRFRPPRRHVSAELRACWLRPPRATARRASASSTPQLISCSVRTDGDWS